jgi:hypothetical protein
MITRNKLLSQAVDDCMKELYSLVQPSVDWNDFIQENKLYSNQYKIWEKTRDTDPNYIGKSITECIGPRPYEFYYLPKDVMKEVVESYVHAYRMDVKQEFLDNIAILKDYCRKPIVDKYIDDYTDENGNHHPGYRGYDHPDNLEKEIFKIIDNNIPLYQPPKKLVSELQDKFFEFLDMAGDFYEWNGDLNSFNMSVYLGPSPNSNKEAVIKNWKQYRNKDIEIDESKYKEEEDE